MRRRTIHMPAIDRRVSLGQYNRAVKMAKDNPETEFKHGLTCWYSCTGADIVKQFYRGVEQRINAGVPAISRGFEDEPHTNGEPETRPSWIRATCCTCGKEFTRDDPYEGVCPRCVEIEEIAVVRAELGGEGGGA